MRFCRRLGLRLTRSILVAVASAAEYIAAAERRSASSRPFLNSDGRATAFFSLAVGPGRAVRFSNGALAQAVLYSDGYILVDRTGVGLLFINSEFRQQIQYDVRFDFELPGQLVDSDLQLHR